MKVWYRHHEFSKNLYTYYEVKTSLPMTFSPLLSQPIWYDSIDYDHNYDGGSSDFPWFVLDQSSISYPYQMEVFVWSHGTVEGEGFHYSLHHPL